jgi:hypothetical protein
MVVALSLGVVLGATLGACGRGAQLTLRFDGGVSGSGGIVAQGGTMGTGGVTGAGGSVGTGGSVGAGGSQSQGGVTGYGGTSTGGSGGTRTTSSTTVSLPRVPLEHRETASSCAGVYSPAEPTNVTGYSQCAKHADCTAGVNGKCVHGIGAAGNMHFCVYDKCATDADCGSGDVCYCESDAARCLRVGNCQTDADCGGNYCSPSMGMDCGGYHNVDSYHCHTPADTCTDNADCTGTDYCNYDEYSGHWKCIPTNKSCMIG